MASRVGPILVMIVCVAPEADAIHARQVHRCVTVQGDPQLLLANAPEWPSPWWGSGAWDSPVPQLLAGLLLQFLLQLPRVVGNQARPAACCTLSRFRARHVARRPGFPSGPALRSTNSADAGASLFAHFSATMPGSDFSESCIIGFGYFLSFAAPYDSGRFGDLPGPGRRRACILGFFDAAGPETGPHHVGPARVAFDTLDSLGTPESN